MNLHSLQMFIVSQASHKPSVALETHQFARDNFLLSIKRQTANVISAYFYLSKLCYFGYYQKIDYLYYCCKHFLTMFVTSSNLLLIDFTLCRFSVLAFLNARKVLGDHAKKTL